MFALRRAPLLYNTMQSDVAPSPAPAPDNQEGIPLEVREQDRLLPIANISRIMKRALPTNAKMSKEAKACIQECVSEFIGFITSEASDRLVEDKRKTITGDDVIDSMKALGFDIYMNFLNTFLERYRQANKAGRTGGSKRGRKRLSATKQGVKVKKKVRP